MDLNINFAGVPFENPFTVAASPSSDSREKVRRALEAGWGGIVFKTTALPSRIWRGFPTRASRSLRFITST